MSNSTPVISLSSSDEEDMANGPPSKKKRISPIMVPNVTLTLVAKPKGSKQIECVSLDSDDESKSSHKDGKEGKSKTEMSKIIHSILNNSPTFKKNGVTIFRNNDSKEETVTLVDSDSDTEASNKTAVVEESDTVHKSVVNGIKTDVLTEEKPQNGESKVKGAKAIVIADSDEEVEKENRESLDESESVTGSTSSSSTKVKDEATQEAKSAFERFLTLVIEKLVGSSFEEILPKKVPIMKKYFKKSGNYANDQAFLALLKQSYDGINGASTCDAANTAVMAFSKVFQHLKTHVQQSTIEIEEDHVPKVKRLEKIIKLLRKKIKQLEQAEVDFDDDGDSTYIILDRYQNRLKTVYAKYCEYIRRNPFSGRPIYDRISFVHSKYNEINQALSRKYRNSVHFPSYYEVEKYIKKTADKAKLNLSELEIKIESEKCFKHLGHILQKKRRQELYDSHLDFIELTEDPAAKDVALENVLRKNFAEGKEKIDEICQKYVNMQEKGDDQVSSNNEEEGKSSESSSDLEEDCAVLTKPVIQANDIADKEILDSTKL